MTNAGGRGHGFFITGSILVYVFGRAVDLDAVLSG
jgi:hypothetical protein